MLSSPVVRKSSLLTDKLLHLLSIISVGQSALKSSQQQQQQQQAANGATPDGRASSQQSSTGGVGGGPSAVPMIGASHLKLAVEVLTSKSCSEEGLEDVTNLLSNLSYGPESTRDTILLLLLQVVNS